MPKRLISIILSFTIVFCSTSLTCFAKDKGKDEGEKTEQSEQKEQTDKSDKTKNKEETQPAVEINVPNAILMEQNSGKVIFEKNADEKVPPASITKVMTLLLVMEALDNGDIALTDEVTCSEYANSMGGSQIWLKVGEKMTVDNLLKATAISSANDASVALAEHVASSADGFVTLMNDKCKELGMENTCFKNCTGLDEDGHVTTARDIAKMSNELLKHDKIKDYSTIWMEDLRNGETQLVNTNKLIKSYNGITGLKTGTTDKAGKCLCATATREPMSLTAVVLGGKTSEDRFEGAKTLLDYGFGNYTFCKPKNINDTLQPLKVKNGVEKQTPIYCEYPKGIVIKKLDEDKVKENVVTEEFLTAPIKKGDVVGKVEVFIDNDKIFEYPIKSTNEVNKMTIGRAMGMLTGSLVNMR